MVKPVKTSKGELFYGAPKDEIIARLRAENRELKDELQRKETRLRQYEVHRNRSLLRDLESVMDALEGVGVDGWPKQDEGRSASRSSGSRGDKLAVARLVYVENAVRQLAASNMQWLDQRQDRQLKGVEVS